MREPQELIGVAPLVLARTKYEGLPARTLQFLTIPDTQFCDIICDSPRASNVRDAIAAALRARAFDWDVLMLSCLPADAVASGLAEALGPTAGIDYSYAAYDTNALIDLTEPWDVFYGRRSRSLKKANNLSANRLKKTGALEIEWLTAAEAAPDRVNSLR